MSAPVGGLLAELDGHIAAAAALRRCRPPTPTRSPTRSARRPARDWDVRDDRRSSASTPPKPGRAAPHRRVRRRQSTSATHRADVDLDCTAAVRCRPTPRGSSRRAARPPGRRRRRPARARAGEAGPPPSSRGLATSGGCAGPRHTCWAEAWPTGKPTACWAATNASVSLTCIRQLDEIEIAAATVSATRRPQPPVVHVRDVVAPQRPDHDAQRGDAEVQRAGDPPSRVVRELVGADVARRRRGRPAARRGAGRRRLASVDRPSHAARILAALSPIASGSVRVLATVVMKFESPAQRGTT